MHHQLVNAYGTEKGAAPALAHLAALAFGLGTLAKGRKDERELMHEAELMNRALQELEAQKMQQTTESLTPDKLASIAGSVGATLARAAAENMDKEALGPLMGMLGRGLGGAISGVGKGLGAAGRTGNTFHFAQAARKAGVGTAAAAPGLSTAARGAGASLQQAGRGLTQAAATASSPLPRAAKSAPLIGTGTKLKLLGGAAALGAGYAGLKGLQATKNYMMVPSGQSTFGRSGSPLNHNINEYGYPTS